MFGEHFYNKNIRNIIIVFGTVFNDISIRRYNLVGGADQILKVPIAYGPSAKYLARIDQREIDGKSNLAITLPRMSFEVTSMIYDSQRKLQRTKIHKKEIDNDNTALLTAYTPVPYNFDIELNVMVKNSDDGAQILEQILPFFTPEFHVTMNEMSTLGIKRDIPIVMTSLTTSDTYEGDFLTRRALIHTLTFTVHGFVYGPTKNIEIIREVDVNVGANLPGNEPDKNINIVADPADAGPEDDFGFTTTVTDG